MTAPVGQLTPQQLDALMQMLRMRGDLSGMTDQDLATIGLTRQQAALAISSLPDTNNDSGKGFWGSLKDLFTPKPNFDASDIIGKGNDFSMGNVLANRYMDSAAGAVGRFNVPGMIDAGIERAQQQQSPSPSDSVNGGFTDSWARTGPINVPAPAPDFSKGVEYNEPFTTTGMDDSAVNPTEYRDSWDKRPQGNPYGLPDVQNSYNDVADIVNQTGIGDIISQLLQGPTVPPPKPPEFTLNDFTDKANEMAASAYSPQFTAIANAEDRAQQNYDASSQVISGLYDQAAQAHEEAQAATAARYEQAIKDSQNRAQNTTEGIGQTYSNAQQQLIDLAKSQGSDPEAIAALLQPGTDQRAWQESMANQAATNHQNLMEGLSQNAQTHQQELGQATSQEGRVQQQNLTGDLNTRLNTLSDRRLDTTSQQRLNAQQLANQLQQNDFGLQKANYGASQDLFGNEMASQQLANTQRQLGLQLAMQLAATQGQAGQSAFEQQMQQWQAEQQARQQQIDNRFTSRQLDIDELGKNVSLQNADANTAKVAADIQKGNQPDYDVPGIGDVYKSIQLTMPGVDSTTANSIANVVMETINQTGSGIFNSGGLQKVLENIANNPALGSPDAQAAARNAAVAYYTNLMNG